MHIIHQWNNNDYFNKYRLNYSLSKNTCMILIESTQNLILSVEETKNYFHPYHQNFIIHSHTDNISIIHYNELIKVLCQYVKKIKIMFSTHTNTLLAQSLLSNGFQCKRKCYEGELNLQTMKFKPNEQLINSIIPFSHYPSLPNDIIETIFNDYRYFHQSISPLNTSITPTIFYQNIQPQIEHNLSYTVQHSQQLFYFVVEKINETTAFTSYIGGLNNKSLLLEVYQTCLVLLQQAGIQTLQYELDDVNPYQMTFSKLFNLPDESYDTYIYERL